MLTFTHKKDSLSGQEYVTVPFKGRLLTEHPIYNKGTAFTQKERDELDLNGVLPATVFDIDIQKQRAFASFIKKSNPMEKYLYLSSLQDRNETLFYALLADHLQEMLPIVYTPTVGHACRDFSYIFRRPRGLYINSEQIDAIDALLDHAPFSNISLIVVTDGERILGLGDLGANGMGIPIGKISLYVAAAGLHPAYCLPVHLDVGTNNEELLNNPQYIGLRKKRLQGDAYDAVVERFITAVRKKFPRALLQWEDFGKNNAFRLLERYRERILSFNDDIQGTGAVATAALFSAMKIKGEKLSDQRFVLFGQGQAGSGIGRMIYTAMRMEGLTDQEARIRIFGIDINGLLIEGMPVSKEQQLFLQSRQTIDTWDVADKEKISLKEVVKNAHATVLIGVTGQSGAFDADILAQMAKNSRRPVILPLSNPTEKSECTAQEAIHHTNGQALVATGSPFDPVEFQGTTWQISQCNNLYIFPGMGLGALICGTQKVTDEMFMAAAEALSAQVKEKDLAVGNLLPSVKDVRLVSAQVALAVAKQAREQGIGERTSDQELLSKITGAMWNPEYLPYRYEQAKIEF